MSAGGGDLIAGYAGDVARMLLGEPNKRLSSAGELRFGNHGSISVDLKTGQFFDHSEEKGGGVLWFIERETGKKVKGGEAVQWLRDNGFHVEDNRSAATGGKAPAAQRERRREPEPDRSSNRNFGPDDREPPARDDGPPWREVKTWDYVDEFGKMLFQVVRMENGLTGKDGKPEKTYRQRRPDSSKPGGWNWSTKDVRQVPYRLPDVLAALSAGDTVFIVEGEKAADRLWSEGVAATTNARGAGKWVDDLNGFFRGANVVSLPDNDPQATNKKTGELLFHEDGRPKFVGLDHARAVSTALSRIANDVRLVELPDLPLKGDIVDWLDAGHSVKELFQLVEVTPRFEPDPYRSKFNAVRWRDLDAPGPEHEWLVKNLLTRGETAMVAGPSKSGKTFLVLDVSMAIARGVDFFGHKTLPGGVIYQAGEGSRGIKKRLRAYRKHHQIPLSENIPFVLLPARLDLYGSDDPTEDFLEEVKHWSSTFDVPLELIVIDTWATATAGANENDGKDVSVILQRCARIARETGACVLLVHHMNADGAKVRGHTSILANLENVLIVRQVEGMHDESNRQLREIVVDKNKDGESGQKIKFVLRSVEIGRDEDGDPVSSCVVCSPDGDASDTAVPERPQVNGNESLLLRAIERAESYSQNTPAQGSNIPPNATPVLWRDVIAEYDKLAFEDEPENETAEAREKRLDARRKLLRRTGESLLRKNVIGRENPFTWRIPRRVRGYRSEWKPEPPDRNRDRKSQAAAKHDPVPPDFDDFDDTVFGED